MPSDHGNGHLNSGLVFKWLPEYQTTTVPGILIASYLMIKQIPMISSRGGLECKGVKLAFS